MQEIPIPGRLPELDVAIEAAVAAGRAIMEVYRAGFEPSEKDDGSPVTEADIRSNEVIKEMLSPTGAHILSEEDADDMSRLRKKRVWIVDPLDGTSDFVDRTGEFTVMIALVEDGRPVLGVIGWPPEGALFAAQSGRGAFRYSDNGWERIAVTRTADVSECRIVGSRHHLTDRERSFIDGLGIKEFAHVGSSLKACRIGAGEAEAYLTCTDKMKEWDTAASYCIVSEAGGRMTDMSGGDIAYNSEDVYHRDGILITNGAMHEKIVREFAESE